MNAKIKIEEIWKKIFYGLSVSLGSISFLLIIYIWLSIGIEAYTNALNFQGYPADGTFQLFNPLRRLAAGQTPGVDFQVFHGIGGVLLHYPFFLLFGKNLFASELSRFILSPTIFFLGSIGIAYAITKKWYAAFTFTILLFFYLTQEKITELIYPFNSSLGIRSFMPLVMGISLIALFSSKKTQFIFSNRNSYWFEVISAFLLGLCLLFGTEHGIAALISFSVTFLLFFPNKKWKERVKRIIIFLGLYIISTSVIFICISGVNFLNPLVYGFIDIQSDQFWYFGAPPNAFLPKSVALFSDPFILLHLGIGSGLFLLSIWIHSRRKFPYSWVMIFLSLYGLIASGSLLGIFTGVYVEPLARINILLGLWVCFTVIPSWLSKKIPTSSINLKRVGTLGVYLLVIFYTVFQTVSYSKNFPSLSKRMEYLTIQTQSSSIPEGGSYLNEGWNQVYNSLVKTTGIQKGEIKSYPFSDINWENGVAKNRAGFFFEVKKNSEISLVPGEVLTFAQSGERRITQVDHNGKWVNVYVEGTQLDPSSDGFPNSVFIKDQIPKEPPVIWSTYSALLEAENNTFQPSGYDYIIHALGKKRRQAYIKSFTQKKPDIVITLKKSFFPYEEWLRNEHGDFYHLLFQNYSLSAENNYYLIWKKNDKWKKEENDWQSIPMEPTTSSVTIPLPITQELKVYEISMTYTIHNPWRLLPIINKLPRFLINPSGAISWYPISLPPYNQEIIFPIIVSPEQNTPTLTLETASLVPGAYFTVDSLRFRDSELDENEVKLFSQ